MKAVLTCDHCAARVELEVTGRGFALKTALHDLRQAGSKAGWLRVSRTGSNWPLDFCSKRCAEAGL